MIISGIQKTSLIDYPEKICTVLFTRGCNFCCGFCHNPELVIPKKFIPEIKIEEILSHLKKRINIIEAVVITGGEPTIHKDLPDFIQKIKSMNYKIKLDTNGTNPKMIETLLKMRLIDFIAMDIKNSLEKYHITTNTITDLDKIKKSANLIKNSNILYEFRTTVSSNLHTIKDIRKIGHWLKGAKRYAIQNFRPSKHIDKNFDLLKPFNDNTLQQFKLEAKKYFQKIEIR